MSKSVLLISVLMVSVSALLLIGQAIAGLSLPGHVYQIDDLDEAQKEAKDWEQYIAFVYTDLDSGCRLAESAAYDAFRELKRDLTIVHACSKKDWKKIPKIIKAALKSPEAGKYIPKTVIVDGEMKKIIAIVPYISDPDKRVAILEGIIEGIDNID